MNFTFNFPVIREGYYKILNFPYWFKNTNLEIYSRIEFAHIILKEEKDHKIEKIQFRHYENVNIESLIFLKIGDKYRANGQKISGSKYQLTVALASYSDIKPIISTKGDMLFNSTESMGTRYYSIEKKYPDKDPLTIIIPSIVIGQAFFLVNSILIKNLFRADFSEVTDLIGWKRKMKDDKIFGEISLKKQGTQEEKALAKDLSFFLFSKDDYLMTNLIKMQTSLYQKLISNAKEKFSYNFQIPIDERLGLVVKGDYQNVGNKNFFVVSEIAGVKHHNNLKNLYDTDYIVFYENSTSQEGSENPSKGNGKGFPTKRKNKKKSTTVTDEGVNNNLAESYIESGNSLLSEIVNLTIVQKNLEKGKESLPRYQKNSPFGTFNKKIPDPTSSSGGISGGQKDNADNSNESSNEAHFSMINFLAKHLEKKYTVTKENIEDDNVRVYRITNPIKSCLYLGADCFNSRIQIFHNTDFGDFDNKEIKNLFSLIKKVNYSWKKMEAFKESSGIIFAQPTNYNQQGTRLKKKEKNKDGTINEIRESNLCCMNVSKKIESLLGS
ncbi:hypothetical protein [Chryseobacterium indoltheticum]|jgi:hypothetical protein|uniref:hypothetical protein n=1 Tax=Chryseobacterium indoltheticum TaxID=254 RepID=UPI00242BB548|nr:hypothetical protein [Chryseobacterium indoltheticum]MDF2833014.1 hypothetical protein [Chryseobacterium indoltheticum]